ncbi:hypothetical protein FA048_11570 [Pedobacter polaris]|uniref:Uncharacterized protein n=1 Tax=Pedobacter polaris TaxID=2571273 RepID=A0A4V5P070_9SPHI|nr:hypothetical protein [Pedobacter polaris]TKC10802.1 hypothetical protein FA048_11570 [Pedobacter polaris]
MTLKTIIMTTVVLLFSITDIKAQNACPLNFGSKQLEKAKHDIKNWNGKIIACDVEVIQVEKGYQSKPYYKVKLEDGGQFWVGSLVTSGYEKTSAKLRLLGYFSLVDKDDIGNKFNKDGFHILSFVVIDLATKQMAMFPGSDKQVKEWMNGTVPVGQK